MFLIPDSLITTDTRSVLQDLEMYEEDAAQANASQMIEQTKEVVARWRTWAALYHIHREEQEMMAKAFEH